jgi:hypothetical protein
MNAARRILALVAALLATCAFAAPAGASVVMALSFDELAADAHRVVLGDVTAVESRWVERDGGKTIETAIDLAVQTELSNASAGSTVRIVQPGGQVGDVGLAVSGMPEFHVGERVLVFLHVTGTDAEGRTTHSVVGMAQGKFIVLPRLLGGFDAIQQFPAGLALAEAGADGTIRPNEARRPLTLDLDEALARIRRVRGEVTL